MSFLNTWPRFIGMLKIKSLKVVCEGCLVRGGIIVLLDFVLTNVLGLNNGGAHISYANSEFLFLQQLNSHVF
jgi:hypothetical protein